MLRTINGIPVIVRSPSIYEVKAYGPTVLRQTICFLGDTWLLHTWLISGHSYGLAFNSRDEALAHLASRWGVN